jgi:SAM-dependent methyltransferase
MMVHAPILPPPIRINEITARQQLHAFHKSSLKAGRAGPWPTTVQVQHESDYSQAHRESRGQKRSLRWVDMGIVGDGSRNSPGLERLARYRWAAQLTARRRVLDAACGGGWGTAVLAAGDAEAVGVDLSPAAIADARQKYGHFADFREGDLRSLPFADSEFDSVVCFEALVHTPTPERVLDEFRRLLRPGGLLLVSAPNRGVYPPGNPLHLSEIDSGELEEMLRARFANVAVHRQQSCFASLLGSAELPAGDDPAAEIAVHVAKAGSDPPGSELYAVAAATDGELPPPPSWLAIGENIDFAEQRKLLEEWQERAVRAEAEVLALKRQLHAPQS